MKKTIWLASLSMLVWLGLTGCTRPERYMAFTNVRLVPMTAEKVLDRHTVLIKGNRIFRIGPADQVRIPKRADFILLENNPLDAVANIKNPSGVMAAGRWFDKKETQNMLDPA